jgi:hypothetical protein
LKLFGSIFIPWEIAGVIPVSIVLIEILKGGIIRPANKITIDLENRIIYLNYTSHFFINRKYQSGFDKIKIDFSKRKSGAIEKLKFIDSDKDTICYIDWREELFSDEDFNRLCKKLDEITFYKN